MTKQKALRTARELGGTMRYVHGFTVPRRVGKGVLCHNHVRHTVDMPCGVNGFRAWREDRPPRGFKKCGCGWSGLPHYSGVPEYKCDSAATIRRMTGFNLFKAA